MCIFSCKIWYVNYVFETDVCTLGYKIETQIAVFWEWHCFSYTIQNNIFLEHIAFKWACGGEKIYVQKWFHIKFFQTKIPILHLRMRGIEYSKFYFSWYFIVGHCFADPAKAELGPRTASLRRVLTPHWWILSVQRVAMSVSGGYNRGSTTAQQPRQQRRPPDCLRW